MNWFKTVFIAAISVLPFFAGACEAIETPEHHEHRELTVATSGKLKIETIGGSIDIKTHAEPTVVFDSMMCARQGLSTDVADQLETVAEVVDGTAAVRMKWKDGFNSSNVSVSGHVTLLVPSDYSIDAHTGGGDVAATGFNGAITANTGGGRITLDHVHGALKANTGGGDIEVESAVGDVDAHTGGGSISMNQVTGNVTARTGGGDLKLNGIAGTINGNSGGGSIHASVVKQIDKALMLTTGGGDIKLTLPADMKADLSAKSSAGDVTCELMMQGTMRQSGFHGKVNGGGPEITLDTGGGSIKVLAASK